MQKNYFKNHDMIRFKENSAYTKTTKETSL